MIEKEKMIFGFVYRPPDAADAVNMAIFQEIRKAARYENVCICGDFNYAVLDWINLVGDSQSERFFLNNRYNFLKQLINEPTRGNNILDLILCNIDNTVGDIEVGGLLGNSDHRVIRF